MKLFEIIDTKHNPNLKPDHGASTIGNVSSFAEVTPDATDPHMVKRDTKSNDPHTAYIEALKGRDQKMASNPYFPRVYETNDANNRMLIRMEKLSEFADINSAELNAITKRILGMSTEEVQAQERANAYGMEYRLKRLQREPNYAFALAVKDIVENKKFDKIKDPKFAEALNLIDRVVTNNELFSIDMHPQNYMIRRGPYGAQLVITDPLS